MILIFPFINHCPHSLNALEASNYEAAPLYKYLKEADKCFEQARLEKKKGKASTLYHLTKYLEQKK